MDIVHSLYFYWCYYYLPQAPVAPVWLLGIVLAGVFRRQYPQTSRVAAVAFLGFLGVSLVNTGLQFWIRTGGAREDVQPVLDVADSCLPIITPTAWLLLLPAVFGWRSAATGAGPAVAQLPAARAITWATAIGGVVGGLLATTLRSLAPFFPDLLETPGTTMVTLGVGLGALTGALAVLTGGAARGAILGAAAGLTAVQFAVVAVESPTPAAILSVLRIGPYAGLTGLLLGATIGWAGRARARRLFKG